VCNKNNISMDPQEIFSVIFSFVGSLFLVCLAVLLGWYFVWKFFLSRFRLVRELLGQMNDNSPVNNSNANKNTNKDSDLRKGGKSKKVRRE